MSDRRNFVEIELIRPSVGRRGILEQEHIEEPSYENVVVHIVSQRSPFLREFALYAADEDADRNTGHALGSW